MVGLYPETVILLVNMKIFAVNNGEFVQIVHDNAVFYCKNEAKIIDLEIKKIKSL